MNKNKIYITFYGCPHQSRVMNVLKKIYYIGYAQEIIANIFVTINELVYYLHDINML